ncbi:MAG TPA: hypoxanthine phosphoribosyltransferase [Candidatus Acidoferrales bacterium]|nr:hypoxanthine phosphoribosyltransferase [Candidatus Acidoferrales bacterium]
MTAATGLPPGISEVIFTPEEIAATVRRLADEIAHDLAGCPMLLLGILKGSFFFAADLARALPSTAEVTMDFLAVSSYGNSDRSSGEVRLLKDTSESVEGKNVIIVEDIVDNGLTLAYLHRLLGGRHPASLRSCVLLDKPYRRKVDVPVDYVGFRCPDTFVVGYGLDYQERFRNLPYVAGLAFGVSV